MGPHHGYTRPYNTISEELLEAVSYPAEKKQNKKKLYNECRRHKKYNNAELFFK